jgi:PAS domain S-box-containing protein
VDTPLQVLIIANSADDAARISRALAQGGFDARCERVETAAALGAALADTAWDLILADDNVPQLSGSQAFRLVLERGLDTPFLVLSSTAGEEAAIALMRAGAHDYVRKDNLARLGISVERALREVEAKRGQERTEQALRDSEARTRAIIYNAVDGMITIDENGTIESFNPAAERLFGYRAGEVLGENVRVLMPPPHRDAHGGYVAQYLRGGERRIIGIGREVWARRKDGTVFPVDLSVSEVMLGPRRIFTGTIHDVTERKRVERRLATQYAVARVLAESTALEDAAPKVLRSLCEATGWELGELWVVDRRARVLRWTGMWHGLHIDPAEFVAVSRATVLQRGSGLPGRVWASGKSASVTDASSSRYVMRTAAVLSAGLKGAFAFPVRAGKAVVAVMGFFSRDTRQPDPELLQLLEALGNQVGGFIARQRAEASRRESEQRFAEFMEHLPGVAFLKNAAGRYLYVNVGFEQLVGLPRAEYIGKTDNQLWPAETAAQLRANDQQVLRSGEVLQTIELIPQDDGLHHWLATKFPLLDATGATKTLAGVAIDITDRVTAETELRELRERSLQRERFADIGAITAQIVHDLGNPLAGISMQAQLILHRAKRDETQPISGALRPAERILAEVSHLDALVREFMEFSRDQRLDLRHLDLSRFLHGVVEIWQPVAAARRINLTVDVREDLPAVEADEEKMRRLFENLLKNAIEAIDRGPGRIHISTSAPAPDRLRISVQDNGPGIPDHVQVFRLFETTKPQGTGLGLAIAKQIVLAHGGDLRFQRVEPHGTVFHVELIRRAAVTRRQIG